MPEPLWKYGTPRTATKDKAAKRQRYLDRRQVRELVYRRESMVCERCTKQCKHPRECWPGDPDMAHVNEKVPRSLGGDPLDLDNVELVCGACHLLNGEHAPTVERMRQIQARTTRKGRTR